MYDVDDKTFLLDNWSLTGNGGDSQEGKSEKTHF